MSPWVALIIFLIIVLIVWLALIRNARLYKPGIKAHPHEEAHAAVETPAAPAPAIHAVAEPALVEPPATPEIAVPSGRVETAPTEPLTPDDLTILEGIGPKVAQLLQQAGIRTFAQLAAAQVGELKAILEPAGLQFMDPSTWAEQARLAAAGKFDELKQLTDSLKGGRKVS